MGWHQYHQYLHLHHSRIPQIDSDLNLFDPKTAHFISPVPITGQFDSPIQFMFAPAINQFALFAPVISHFAKFVPLISRLVKFVPLLCLRHPYSLHYQLGFDLRTLTVVAPLQFILEIDLLVLTHLVSRSLFLIQFTISLLVYTLYH